ncbi:hypothetical protein ACMA1D_01295 [Streptomyces sp. 796.1]|uniref:hypothetical protein n=1 Tax=Streptomyces sp. 796.1 TaxID=3163029 RepID=UPI0039C9672F
MDEQDDHTPTGMPAAVRFSVVALWLQVVVWAVSGWYVLSRIDERHEHGQPVEAEGPLQFLAVFFFALALCLLVAGFCFFRRSLLACKLVYGYEVVAVALGVLGIAVTTASTGFEPALLIGPVLPGAVCWALSSEGSDDWFLPLPQSDAPSGPADEDGC